MKSKFNYKDKKVYVKNMNEKYIKCKEIKYKEIIDKRYVNDYKGIANSNNK